MADGSVVIGITLDTAEFKNSITAVEAQIAGIGGRVSSAVMAAFAGDGVEMTFQHVMSGISRIVGYTADDITNTMRSAANQSAAVFSQAGWQEAGSAAAGKLSAGFDAGGGAVRGTVARIAASLKGIFGGGWDAVGKSMMEGLADGITSAGNEVVASIKKVSAETTAAIKEYYEIRSPSALMRDEVGVMISRGIAEGITDGAGFINAALGSVGGDKSLTQMVGDGGSKRITQNIYLRDSDSSPYRTALKIRRESEAAFR